MRASYGVLPRSVLRVQLLQHVVRDPLHAAQIRDLQRAHTTQNQQSESPYNSEQPQTTASYQREWSRFHNFLGALVANRVKLQELVVAA